MCGIFGLVTTRSAGEVESILGRGTGAMRHRGPDDEGLEIVRDEGRGLTVALGHRRLSILDLSPAGHQPMRDEATGNWIVYNGEVFNFRAVRADLKARGLTFRTQTDTEVLLKGFGQAGRRAIEPWRGMFAFGFWQAGEGKLTLVRDRLGIKPLYYYRGRDFFLFGSEVRALLSTGLIPRRLSLAAVDSFLAYGSIQQPLTIIENLYAVLPGHLLEYQAGQIRSFPYWEIKTGEAEEKPPGDELLIEEIRALTLEAVRLRMVSDVPVSVFLSGGIDSSAVVSLMRQATNSEIRSFSVNFREREFNEQRYAEQIARRHQTDHTSVLLTEEEILAKLPEALRALDQPSIDGINTYIVSQATARAGMKVAISGLGGDEGFLGYGFFSSMTRDEKWRRRLNRLPSRLRAAAGGAIGVATSGARAGKLGSLLRGARLDEHSVKLYRQLFTEAQRRELLREAATGESEGSRLLAAWSSRQWENCREADAVNQASALELGGYMSNTLLRDTDTMSMAHSLEVRVPLIDHLLVERLLSLPGPTKLREGRPKWLLVEAAGDLPLEIVQRRKKGFELPFRIWLRGALRDRLEEALAAPELHEVVDPAAIRRVWRDFLAERTTWSRVWALFVLSQWLGFHLKEKA